MDTKTMLSEWFLENRSAQTWMAFSGDTEQSETRRLPHKSAAPPFTDTYVLVNGLLAG